MGVENIVFSHVVQLREMPTNKGGLLLVFCPMNEPKNVGSRLSILPPSRLAGRTSLLSAAPGKFQQIAEVRCTLNSRIQCIHVDRREDCDASVTPAGQLQLRQTSTFLTVLLHLHK
jgi:hypothetical protein